MRGMYNAWSKGRRTHGPDANRSRAWVPHGIAVDVHIKLTIEDNIIPKADAPSYDNEFAFGNGGRKSPHFFKDE